LLGLRRTRNRARHHGLHFPAPWLAGLLCLVGVPVAAEGPAPAEPVETLEQFLDRANGEFDESDREQGAAVWVNVTYLTEDTDLLAARASARDGELRLRMAEEARRFIDADLTLGQRRDLSLISRAEYMPERMALPADPELRNEMTIVQRRMASTFASGRYCPEGEASCKSLGELSDILATSREPSVLLDAWQGWHSVGDTLRDDFRRFRFRFCGPG